MQPAVKIRERRSPPARPIEVSIVLPCLNEAETLAACIKRAQRAIAEHELSAEIVVADNGSSDGSRQIARRLGARVVEADERGYGAALKAGVGAARGRFIVMADADMSYDLGAVYPFIEKLRQGFESIDDPEWGTASSKAPLIAPCRYEPMRKITDPSVKII